MSDDRYLISPPPTPEATQPALHPRERKRTNFAIAVAILAAAFTGYQAYEARQARIDAHTASEQQRSDVERSRIAAEKSEEAANRGADAAWASVKQLGELADIAKTQAQQSRKDFELEHRPILTMADASYAWLLDRPPLMDPQRPTNIKVHWAGSGTASNCTLRSGARFARDKKEIQSSDYVLLPGVLDLTGETKISYDEAVSVGSLSLGASSDNVKLYLFGKADCSATIGTSKRFHSEWCFYFPVEKDGRIVDFIHGCKNPLNGVSH